MTTSFAYDDQVIFAITCKICHTTIFTSLPSNNELSIRIYNVRANNLVTRQHVKLFTKAIRYDSPLLEDIIDHQDAELQEIFDLHLMESQISNHQRVRTELTNSQPTVKSINQLLRNYLDSRDCRLETVPITKLYNKNDSPTWVLDTCLYRQYIHENHKIQYDVSSNIIICVRCLKISNITLPNLQDTCNNSYY